MAIIDYNSVVGKLKLRLGDISDFPFLPDSVYQAVYEEKGNNINKAVIACGSMILGQLSFRTHERMIQFEVFGGEAFKQFKEFLLLTIKDPSFMDISPLPYSSSQAFSPIIDFQKNWNRGFGSGSEAQQLAFNADISPNDNSRTGINLVIS